jgi:hypothetical protein
MEPERKTEGVIPRAAVRPLGLANEARVAWDGASPSARAGDYRRQAPSHVILTGRAISVPFRARPLRFATVNHGHSRSSDLRMPC